ncbi:MAG: 50S ribosomal protein L25/general stress protein Ctc [Bacteroidaceae bacterium]
MKEISIKGTKRSDLGKKASKEIRKAKAVPCVVYGVEKGENGLPVATHFTITNDVLRTIVYTPNIYVANLDIDGTVCKAILKDIQFHPVSDEVLHVDFYAITPEKPIVMAVPVATKGLAEGVRAGGKLATLVRRLKVKATYDKIPDNLIIDVTNLGLGKNIKVNELSFEGLEIMTAKEVVVVSVKITRAAQGAAAAAATTAAK